MTEYELAEYNIGENLDQIMNIDPRGYGVCRILYPAARKYAGGNSLSMNTAKKLHSLLVNSSSETLVYVQTGFILRPHLQPETDGITGALLFIRALIQAYNITPVIIIPEKVVAAVINCAPIMGLHVYHSIEKAQKLPLSFAYKTISVNQDEADYEIEKLLLEQRPVALFSTETAGANLEGQYHNAVGVNMTEIEAKQDNLFVGLQNMGVPCFAVGDLGNEIGMGAIEQHIKQFIPFTGGITPYASCQCGCSNGIAAATKADYLVTATVSDWGVYAVIAALAFLNKNIEIMHDEKMEELVLTECSRSGMVDMTGSLLPAIDGFPLSFEKQIVALMRSSVDYAIHYRSETWFPATIEKGFYEPKEVYSY